MSIFHHIPIAGVWTLLHDNLKKLISGVLLYNLQKPGSKSPWPFMPTFTLYGFSNPNNVTSSSANFMTPLCIYDVLASSVQFSLTQVEVQGGVEHLKIKVPVGVGMTFFFSFASVWHMSMYYCMSDPSVMVSPTWTTYGKHGAYCTDLTMISPFIHATLNLDKQ